MRLELRLSGRPGCVARRDRGHWWQDIPHLYLKKMEMQSANCLRSSAVHTSSLITLSAARLAHDG
jgi:hypothetical protein